MHKCTRGVVADWQQTKTETGLLMSKDHYADPPPPKNVYIVIGLGCGVKLFQKLMVTMHYWLIANCLQKKYGPVIWQ